MSSLAAAYIKNTSWTKNTIWTNQLPKTTNACQRLIWETRLFFNSQEDISLQNSRIKPQNEVEISKVISYLRLFPSVIFLQPSTDTEDANESNRVEKKTKGVRYAKHKYPQPMKPKQINQPNLQDPHKYFLDLLQVKRDIFTFLSF